MSERFYIDGPLGPGRVLLQGAEARHLALVCRLRPGQQVRLFNGDGREYPAAIIQVDKKQVELNVGEPAAVDRELPFQLLVACPLPKGDRGQFLVEKLTELGVTAFVSLQTQNSVIHAGERRRHKLQRYVIEASKQCGRNVLMRVEPEQKWYDFLIRPDLPQRRLLAHPGGGDRISTGLADTAIATGPEGGFTESEVAQAKSAGWCIVDLGPRILRVETAALAMVCACLQVARPLE